MRQDTDSSLLCLCIGLGIGVIAGMALAPQSGAVTRRRAYFFVTSSARELYQRGLTLADEAGELFEEGEHLMGSGNA